MTTKVENILTWVGTAGAIISAVAYIVVTVVLVLGFETNMKMEQQLLFATIGAVAGISITWMLRTQGIAFAKEEPESKTVMKTYHKALNRTKKKKQLRTITYHIVVRSIIDIFTKVTTVGFSTYFMLYIFMEGSGDFGLIGLAIANLLLFTSFGLLALAKAYHYYIEEHLPAIIERTNLLNQIGFVQSKETKNACLQQHEVQEFATASTGKSKENQST
jgi:Na+/melibiose symporter-like transporter